ncbi:MAG: hypothetical protein IR526_01590 [Bordetella sp.]|nr:MAG: hypothetical protein IR526_01590 [Bordetella sp.]
MKFQSLIGIATLTTALVLSGFALATENNTGIMIFYDACIISTVKHYM